MEIYRSTSTLDGGFYERLNALVKRGLRKSIGKICLTSSQLYTVLVEVEAVVNSRPIVYVGTELDDWCLCPADFLSLNPKTGIPENCTVYDAKDPLFQPNFSSSERLLQIWEKGQKHLNVFWKIWAEDYLLSLRERTQLQLRGPRIRAKSPPHVGEVVLIKDNLPRGTWKLGRIEELITSQDGEVRSANIRLPSGNIIGRPLNLLCPLECHEAEIDSTENDTDTDKTGNSVGMGPTTSSIQVDNSTNRRPQRKAAIAAKAKVAQWLKQ